MHSHRRTKCLTSFSRETRVKGWRCLWKRFQPWFLMLSSSRRLHLLPLSLLQRLNSCLCFDDIRWRDRSRWSRCSRLSLSFIYSTGSSIFSCFLKIRLSLICWKLSPKFGDLLDSISPDGNLLSQVRECKVSINDWRDSCHFTQCFICFPFNDVFLSLSLF